MSKFSILHLPSPCCTAENWAIGCQTITGKFESPRLKLRITSKNCWCSRVGGGAFKFKQNCNLYPRIAPWMYFIMQKLHHACARQCNNCTLEIWNNTQTAKTCMKTNFSSKFWWIYCSRLFLKFYIIVLWNRNYLEMANNYACIKFRA